MGETLRGFRPSAHRGRWQGPDIALNERLIHVGNGIAVLGEPSPKLLAGTQGTPDTVWSIPVLVQGGGEGLQVGAKRPVPQLGDHRGARKAVLDHRVLLFS